MKYPTGKIWERFLFKEILISLIKLAENDNIPLFLVGGTVRDLILDRPLEDLDFAVDGNAMEFSSRFAQLMNASFIPLDERNDMARLVFRKEKFYMDFARFRGPDIISDLMSRDFTINAMGIDVRQILYNDELEILDPSHGIQDLKDRVIKPTSSQSILADPVRMLRMFRFSAKLDFSIHSTALELAKEALNLMFVVAGERTRDELFKILAVPNSIKYLKEMDKIGLLEKVFPEIIPMKGMEQGRYHHLDVWGHSVLTLEFLELNPIPEALKRYNTEIDKYLKNELVIGRSKLALLKLAALLHDVGKPATKTIDEKGQIRFFGHNTRGAESMPDIGFRLRLANREIAYLEEVINEHMYLLGLLSLMRKPGSKKEKDRAIRRFIQKNEEELISILLISYADLQATQGELRKIDDLDVLNKLMGDIADTYFQKPEPSLPRLITGDEIMAKFGLPASPIIGKLLGQLEEAQMNGSIKTKDDAIEFVRNILLEIKT